ncbi:porin family protein [Ferrimonas sediminicola]|nr:porin family protein [Ferrimonas sediminicola]
MLALYQTSVLANTRTESETMYLGLSVAFIDATLESRGEPSGSLGIDNTLLGITAGYQFNDMLAAEFRAYGNVEDDTIEGVDIEVEHHFSVLGKLSYPVHKYFKPYVIAGYGTTKGSIEGFSDSEADFTYGAGIDITNSRGVSLQLEWQRVIEDDFDIPGVEFEIDTINLNVVYKFALL